MPVDPLKIVYLTDGSQYSDYRPAIDGSGQVVVFERNLPGYPAPQLCKLAIASPDNFSPFVPSLSQYSQSRPDWNWNKNLVTFNIQQQDNGLLICCSDSSGLNPTQVPNISVVAYPTWDLNGEQLTGMWSQGSPAPSNYVISLDGTPSNSNISGVWPNVNGSETVDLYGGMPAVSPQGLPMIAFAGQPVGGWNGKFYNQYNQEYNYIFISDPNSGNSFPLERSSSEWNTYNPNLQGARPLGGRVMIASL